MVVMLEECMNLLIIREFLMIHVCSMKLLILKAFVIHLMCVETVQVMVLAGLFLTINDTMFLNLVL